MEQKLRIAVYGDSLMKGTLPDEQLRYHFHTDLFEAPLTGVDAEVTNKSVFGATSRKGVALVQRDLARGHRYDWALIEYGGNDCNYDWADVAAHPEQHHDPVVLADEFRANLTTIVQMLREAGVRPIFTTLPQAKALSAAAVAAGGQVDIHLKADTGMGRIGFALRTDFDKAIAEMLEACALPGLHMTGLFQHFAVADDNSADNIAYTNEQYQLFVRAYKALKAAGQEPPLVHCDNSAGVMLHPEWPKGEITASCMARPGIILYGFDPSDEVRFGKFRPVMKLKTVVSMVKELQPGQSTSYGRRFTAEKPTKVATLCTGYADGYPRQLSCGKGIVEIHGTPCPVLGRVCMDQLMVDVTALPDVQEGDEAILWGGEVSDSAEDIARKTDTISYEVLCGVSRRVPRVYLEQGRITAIEDWILQ